MALLRLYQYDITVLDELRSSSEDDRQSENIVIDIRKTDGTAPTLYSDRYGNTTFTNPSVINTTFKKHTFYTSETSLRYAVFDYGNSSDNDHALRIGRYAHGVMGNSDPKVVVLPRWGAYPRLIRVPFLATGTDASDTPNTWDNAEAKAVLVNGSSTNIVLPKGLVITDAILEVVTADSGETIECGLNEGVGGGETGGDLNGFVNGASLTTAGFVVPQGDVTLGSNADYWATSTLGAYLANFTAGADTNAASLGEYVPRVHVCDGVAKTVTVKGSAGIDTADGYVWLKGYMLPSIREALYDLV